MAEWLRRWTANPLGSARVGSNPILVEFFGAWAIICKDKTDRVVFPVSLFHELKTSGTGFIQPSVVNGSEQLELVNVSRFCRKNEKLLN